MASVRKTKLAVLISGNGSNLQSLINHTQANRLPAEIVLVISNRADAHGLQRAADAKLPSIALPSQGIPRQTYDQLLITTLHQYQPDWIVLAGYMRILTAAFIKAFANRITNIHPSLLPAYKGLDTHRRVIADHQNQHGCSVHLVTDELDAGPVLAQANLEVAYPVTESTLAARIHALEHQLYPLTLYGLCSNQYYNTMAQSWQPTLSPQQTIFTQVLTASQLHQVFQTWQNC